jgi:hypothetical protein
LPLVVLFGEDGADEADHGVAVGQDGDHVGAAARKVQRGRLWARQARPSQVALALNVPEGTWARPPALTSRMVSSTPAWPRWSPSSHSMVPSRSVRKGW